MARKISPAATLRQILSLMQPPRKRQFAGLLVLMLTGGLAEIATIASVVPFIAIVAGQALPDSLAWVGNLSSTLNSDGDHGRVIVAAALFAGLAVVAGLIRLLLSWSTLKLVFGFGHELALDVQRRILSQPYSFHLSRNSGQILAATEKVDLLTVGFLLQLMFGITSAFIALFIVAILMRIDALIALVAAAGFGGLYLIVSVTTARRLDRNSQEAAASHDQRFKIVQESLGGIRDVIIDSSQAVFLETFRRADRTFSDSRANSLFIGTAPRAIIESGGMVVVAVITLLLWNRQGALGPALPVLGAMAVGAFRLLPVLQQLFYSWTIIAGNRAAADQVLELLELPLDERSSEEAADTLPFNRAIKFEDVTFRYPGARSTAIHKASVTLPAGSRVALVGRTGAGKTTFADLLLGLLAASEGAITVDGVPIINGVEKRWQRNIAHVPQSIFLADADIARNIAFTTGEDAVDRTRLLEAVRIAQLEPFIANLPDGLTTTVGERGIRLSGGQRQRIGIARAVYKGARVLVLDEATNALDAETEAAVMKALFEASDEKQTIIVISHRPSAIAGCDLIVRVEGGEVSAHRSTDAAQLPGSGLQA